MTSLFSLEGRTALVTGARSGIGGAIAVGLAAAGADVVLHGHHDDLAATRASVESHGRRVRSWSMDFDDPELVGPAIDEILADERIDILVHNAGLVRRDPALEVELADWRRVMSVNLDSAFVLAQRVGAPMVARGSGKIILIASMLSFQGGINQPAYAASKHGLAGLTKALSNEWAAHNVQINALAPGYIATGLTAALTSDPDREREIRRRIPAGRWGTPDDLVGAAVFLSSSASDYVSGHVLAVDGGWLGR
jgi:2-deoxy-D-gluconate 3-dehydrogenase